MRAKFASAVAAVAVLTVGAVLIVGGDGDAPEQADEAGGTCSGSIDDGIALEYQPARRASAGALAATLRVLCDRALALAAETSIQRRGGGVVIELAAGDEDVADDLARGGELRFYDWEPNVVGRDGRPGSGDPGPVGRLGSLHRAAKLAARARPLAEPTDHPDDRANDGEQARSYSFDGEKIDVPRGIAIVEDEPPPNAGPRTPRFYFVIEDDVELSGEHVRNLEQNVDPNTEEPILTMEFTPEGRRRFQRVTRRIAARGARQRIPPGGSPESWFQRFVIVLDGRIVSMATIDFVENPRGIDGTTGAQINGIGDAEETRRLVDLLREGALPVPLELVRRRELGG